MLIDNLIYYSQKKYVVVNQPDSPLYFFFDLDERSYNINMRFQHFHPFYEIHILLDSYANLMMEGTPYRMQLFDIACLKPNLLHKSEYPIGSPKKRLVIQFQIPTQLPGLNTELEQILEVFHCDVPIYRFSRNILKKLFTPINDIYSSSQKKSEINTLMVYTNFLEFLSTLFIYQSENLYEPEMEDSISNKIYSIATYIHSHFREDLSLEALSKIFYMSPYYLSHQFKAVMGVTLTNYIQITRIQNVQQMLLSSENKITKIAEECGFASFSQFNRVFHKFCEVSPRDYKKNYYKNLASKDKTILWTEMD